MQARVYVIPGSHPSLAAELMLKRKGIPYSRRDLIPLISRGFLRASGFGGATVPALRLDGRRVQGSIEIARELDRVRPDPPLLPTDPERRAAAEEAERWGEGVLQDRIRRMIWRALRRDRAPMASYAEGAHLGVPVGLAVKAGGPIVTTSAWIHGASDEAVRGDLAALPAELDRIEGWIADGVLGSREPNAADYQIGTSVRSLLTFDDLRPFLEGRPAGELALRIAPRFPGRIPPVFPEAWLAPLRAHP